jgi:hypothetical protein
MARRLMILGALLLVLAPSIGLPQAGPAPTPIYTGPPPPAPGWNNAGMSTFPAGPGTGWGNGRRLYEDEQWVVTGDVRFGHMWMRFNTFFPFNSNPDPEQQIFAFERMDLQLQDGNFWVGFGGLEVQPVPTFVLFAQYGINIPRLSHMLMDATGRFTRPGFNPFGTTDVIGNGANSISPWTWDTTFHWWMLDTGGAWWFTPELAFEAGFRLEHIDYRLQNPRGVSEAVDAVPPGLAISCNRI